MRKSVSRRSNDSGIGYFSSLWADPWDSTFINIPPDPHRDEPPFWWADFITQRDGQKDLSDGVRRRLNRLAEKQYKDVLISQNLDAVRWKSARQQHERATGRFDGHVDNNSMKNNSDHNNPKNNHLQDASLVDDEMLTPRHRFRFSSLEAAHITNCPENGHKRGRELFEVKRSDTCFGRLSDSSNEIVNQIRPTENCRLGTRSRSFDKNDGYQISGMLGGAGVQIDFTNLRVVA